MDLIPLSSRRLQRENTEESPSQITPVPAVTCWAHPPKPDPLLPPCTVWSRWVSTGRVKGLL